MTTALVVASGVTWVADMIAASLVPKLTLLVWSELTGLGRRLVGMSVPDDGDGGNVGDGRVRARGRHRREREHDRRQRYRRRHRRELTCRPTSAPTPSTRTKQVTSTLARAKPRSCPPPKSPRTPPPARSSFCSPSTTC